MSAGMLKAWIRSLCPTTAATQMPANSRERRSRSHRESVQEDPRATGGDRRPPEPERPPRGTAGLTPCPKAPAYYPPPLAPRYANAKLPPQEARRSRSRRRRRDRHRRGSSEGRTRRARKAAPHTEETTTAQECQRKCNYVGEDPTYRGDNEVYICPDLKLTCFVYPNRTSRRSPRPALRLLAQLRHYLRRRGSVTISSANVGGSCHTPDRQKKGVKCCDRRGPRSDSATEPESTDDESIQASQEASALRS